MPQPGKAKNFKFFRLMHTNECVYLYIQTHSAYDRAAIKFRGVEADINFSIEDYEDDLKQVGHL